MAVAVYWYVNREDRASCYLLMRPIPQGLGNFIFLPLALVIGRYVTNTQRLDHILTHVTPFEPSDGPSSCYLPFYSWHPPSGQRNPVPHSNLISQQDWFKVSPEEPQNRFCR